MKPRHSVALLLLFLAVPAGAAVTRARLSSSAASTSNASASSTAVAAAGRFGPNQCVGIERASSGSCVIKTDCQGQDTNSLEFAFDCWSANGDIYRHSYGRGGFADHEDFDTEVSCVQCRAPSTATRIQPAKPPTPSQQVPMAVAKATEAVVIEKTKAVQHPLAPMLAPALAPASRAAAAIRGTEERKAVAPKAPRVAGSMGDLENRQAETAGFTVSKYGPKSCVSTWRNQQGHCVMQTACQDVDISSYEFGLICVDGKGKKTRHTFGRGSFDVSETFDTLAECSQCLGLDDPRVLAFRAQRRRWRQSAEASEVATLSAQVHTLTQGLGTMLGAVMKLKQKVHDQKIKKSTPAPSVVAKLAEWRGEDTTDAATQVGGDEGSKQASPVPAPRLRAAAAMSAPVANSQKDVRRHRHRRHRRRRRIVEDEDEDDDEDDKDSRGVREAKVWHTQLQAAQSHEQEEKRAKMAKKSDEEDEDERDDSDAEDDDDEETGDMQPLTESAGAEASELEIAEDGEASGDVFGAIGIQDDGKSMIDAAW